MNEKEFLDLLRKELEESGVDEIYIEKYVTQFKRYFDNISDDDISEQINSLGDMSDIVENLINLIEAKKHSNASCEVSSDANIRNSDEDHSIGNSINGSTEEACEENYQEDNDFEEHEHSNVDEQDHDAISNNCDDRNVHDDENEALVHAGEENSPHDSTLSDRDDIPNIDNTEAEHSEKEDTDESKQSDSDYGFLSDAVPTDVSNVSNLKDKNAEDYYDDYIFEGMQLPIYEEKHHGFLENIFKTRRKFDNRYDYYDDEDEEYEAYRRKIEDERFFGRWEPLNTETSKKYFWGIGLGTLPITLFLFLVMSGVFLFGFGALSLAIVALIAFLVVITAVGAAIAISGIIFGIVKCFSVFPIGLYEIGMSVKYCGIALALGILVYNTAVRLMPLAIRYLINLYFVTLRYVKKGVYIFRQRCANLK